MSIPAGPAPAPPSSSPPPEPWQITLAGEFESCAAALTDQISDPNVVGPALDKLLSQQQQYRLAASDLRTTAIGNAIADTGTITASLAQATADAQAAATRVANISHAVALAASLLNLATAITTAVATGSPGSLLSAAQSVITAASKV
jgi:hypothetical protein